MNSGNRGSHRPAEWSGLQEIAQLTIDKSHDAIFWHRGAQIVYVNEQACRALGYTREELVCMSLDDIDDGLPSERKEALMDRILHDGSAIFETVNIRKDGSRFPVELSVTAHEIDGEILFCGVARDISERRKAENELLASQRELEAKIQQLKLTERRYKLAIEGGRLGTFEWILPEGGGVVSDSFYRLFGLQPNASPLTYATFVEHTHPEDLAKLQREFGVARKLKKPVATETRIKWPDGSFRWIEIRAKFAYSSDGQPYRLDGVIVDIDEKKATQASLNASTQNLQLVLAASQMGTFKWDLQTGAITCSPKAYTIWGYATPPSNLDFKLFSTHIHPDDVATVTSSLEVSRTRRTLHQLEHRIIDALGELKWVEVRGQFVFDQNGKATHMHGVVADATQRKKADKELHLRRFAVDVASEAMFTISLDGRIIDVNQLACERLGDTRETLLQKRITEITINQITSQQFDEAIEKLKKLGSRVYSGQHQQKDGRIIDVEVSARVFEDQGQEYICATVRDVTKLMQAEKKLRDLDQQVAHLNRLDSMGELASTIAHELNQPLSVIANNAALLESLADPKLADEIHQLTDTISSQAVLAGDIIRRMRRFCLNKAPTRTMVSLQEVIEESIRLLESKLRHDCVAVETEFETIEDLMVDRVQIQQVLVNLFSNGIEAMRSIDHRDRVLSVKVDLIEDFVRISVSDNGPGIRSEQGKNIFEPFHSSKPDGMGMGLPISRSIVEAHGGRLRLDESQPDETTFHIELPAFSKAD